MLYVVITLVKNVPRQHHCSYLKFYCSHMSIFLQQTIGRSDVRGQFLFSLYFFFVYAFILEANAESYEKYSAINENATHQNEKKLCIKPNLKIAHISCYMVFCFLCRRNRVFFSSFVHLWLHHIKTYRRHNIFTKYLSHIVRLVNIVELFFLFFHFYFLLV